MEGELQIIVGANVRRLRVEMGASQERFGERIGWHRTFVGAVERGERNLTLKTVERLAGQLAVHPVDLLLARDERGAVLVWPVEPEQPVEAAVVRSAAAGPSARRGGDVAAARPVDVAVRSARPRPGRRDDS